MIQANYHVTSKPRLVFHPVVPIKAPCKPSKQPHHKSRCLSPSAATQPRINTGFRSLHFSNLILHPNISQSRSRSRNRNRNRNHSHKFSFQLQTRRYSSLTLNHRLPVRRSRWRRKGAAGPLAVPISRRPLQPQLYRRHRLRHILFMRVGGAIVNLNCTTSSCSKNICSRTTSRIKLHVGGRAARSRQPCRLRS